MSGHFKLLNKVKLADIDENTIIKQSDFSTITPEGMFVQLEYIEEDEAKREKTKVKPGLFTIKKNMSGLYLEPTSYITDSILEEFVSTKEISNKIDKFFAKLDVYKEFGIEVPKRGCLLYGSAGSGKSTSLNKISREYVSKGDTVVLMWPTDKFEAYDVKDFIQTFEYVEGASKLILIVEDIGGIEVDQVRMKSDSSLLSLLDNQEKTFTIPTFIVATTNFPEVFLGNLTNRPGRFDDKIEVTYPPKEARASLLKFFSKGKATQEQIELIQKKDYQEFNPAHIKEAFIRSAIHDKTLEEVLKEMKAEIDLYKKAFSKQKNMNMNMSYDE